MKSVQIHQDTYITIPSSPETGNILWRKSKKFPVERALCNNMHSVPSAHTEDIFFCWAKDIFIKNLVVLEKRKHKSKSGLVYTKHILVEDLFLRIRSSL